MIDAGEVVRKLALNAARFSGLTPLARRIVGGVGAILMLHRVTAAETGSLGVNRHLAVAPAFLDDLIGAMKADGYVFLSMDEVVARLKSGHAGDERFATITADDAYRDNLTEALPVLERHAAPFTVYAAPALIEGRVELWWDVLEEVVARANRIDLTTPLGRVRIDASTPLLKFQANKRIHDHLTNDVPEEDQVEIVRELARAAGIDPARGRREALMDWSEIATIARHPLVTVGAHTVNHYNLMRLGAAKALDEMREAACILEKRIGMRPRHMAYPYGYRTAVGAREVQLAARAGFDSAVTTRHGLIQAEHAHHLHALPRISINGRYQDVGHVRTMLSGITTPIANGGRRVVTV